MTTKPTADRLRQYADEVKRDATNAAFGFAVACSLLEACNDAARTKELSDNEFIREFFYITAAQAAEAFADPKPPRFGKPPMWFPRDGELKIQLTDDGWLEFEQKVGNYMAGLGIMPDNFVHLFAEAKARALGTQPRPSVGDGVTDDGEGGGLAIALLLWIISKRRK